jgi:hypothetical protein
MNGKIVKITRAWHITKDKPSKYKPFASRKDLDELKTVKAYI